MSKIDKILATFVALTCPMFPHSPNLDLATDMVVEYLYLSDQMENHIHKVKLCISSSLAFLRRNPEKMQKSENSQNLEQSATFFI